MIEWLSLEERWNYWLELMWEIYEMIWRLSSYSSDRANNVLEDINRKIDLARENWLNVEDLDSRVLEYRIISLKNDIVSRIGDINKQNNPLSLDISDLIKRYNELKNERYINVKNFEIVVKQMKELELLIFINKVKFMIANINWTDDPAFDKLVDEILGAEERGIDTTEAKNIVFW